MKKVLNEWNFYFFIIVTDNGANMIKVFQLATTIENVEAVINDVAAGQNESAGFLAESTDEENDYTETDQVILDTPLVPDKESESPTRLGDSVDKTEPWECVPSLAETV
ncbi:Uncharacterized protein APZ42_004791 [Daphnia magna]|uniref:Uncharacterized protein n=1 Tax=Daphnia magna TaxID=35525 RepID=A0A164GUF9_9CRUS|nr:Uncharacterized protein APZ42_004791 [Daphnia magna]